MFIEYRIKHCRNYQRRAPIVNLKQNLNEKKYSHRAKAVPKIFLLFIKRISPCWSSLLGFSSSTILFSPMALCADGFCFFFVLKCVNYNRNITRRVHINVVIDLREGNSFLPRGSITMLLWTMRVLFLYQMEIIAEIGKYLWPPLPNNIKSDIAWVILPYILLQPCNKYLYCHHF